MKVLKCDRCGNVYDPGAVFYVKEACKMKGCDCDGESPITWGFHTEGRWGHGEHHYMASSSADLCPSCVQEIVTTGAIKGGKIILGKEPT